MRANRTLGVLRSSGVGTLWIVACVALGYWTMAYDFSAGRVGPVQSGWPTGTQLVRIAGARTVVAFLHPRCVCSGATVKQLIKTIHAHPGAEVIAAMFVPDDATHSTAVWEQGEYVRVLQASLPSAHIVYDRGGREAQRFGAFTSGTVLVFDRQGREIFRGGITNRRGGEDDNLGLERLAQVVTAEHSLASAAPTPIFGCPLVVSVNRQQEERQ